MLKSSKQIIRKKDSSVDSNNRRSTHFTFFVFIVISAIFWLLIKLSQEYSQNYDMNIIYKDVPVNKLLTQKVDSTVKFSITSRGFYLAELSLLHPDELIIHLKNYTIHKADENIYYISTLPLKEKIAKILDINPSNVSFSKNVLSFLMEKLYSKNVKVRSAIRLNFDGSFNLYNPPVTKPSSVMIYGPKAALDTIDLIKTTNLEISNIKENKSLKVGLINPLPGLLRLNPQEVTLNLQVEKFTQSSIVLPISTTFSRFDIETFPENVTVYFDVALKDFEKVNANQFLVSPDLTNIDLSTARKLHLVIRKHPDFVRNLHIDPVNIEFIIIK